MGWVGFGVGGLPGAAAGAVVGSVSGFATGTAACAVHHFHRYNLWLKRNQAKEVFRELRQFHQDHEAYNAFCDPITLEILVDPVRSPYNHVYNRSTIAELIGVNGLVEDPFRNPSYARELLVDAPEVFNDMWEADMTILKQELEDEQISPGVKAGLEAFIQDLELAIEGRRRFKEDQRASEIAMQKGTKSSCQIM